MGKHFKGKPTYFVPQTTQIEDVGLKLKKNNSFNQELPFRMLFQILYVTNKHLVFDTSSLI